MYTAGDLKRARLRVLLDLTAGDEMTRLHIMLAVASALPLTAIPAQIDSTTIIRGGAAFGDPLGTVRRAQLIDTLALQRREWEQKRPDGYLIRVLSIDHCIVIRTNSKVPPTHMRLVVRDTTVVRREEAPVPLFYSSRCGHEWRVDDLFRDVAQALADTTVNVLGVQYDPAYGFPRHYWTSRRYDRPAGVLVESFAPVP